MGPVPSTDLLELFRFLASFQVAPKNANASETKGYQLVSYVYFD